MPNLSTASLVQLYAAADNLDWRYNLAQFPDNAPADALARYNAILAELDTRA